MSLQAIVLPPKSEQPPTALIVLLHGWGANAQDVAFLCSLIELPAAQFVLPDAPFPHPYGIGGKMWYNLSENLNFQTDVTTQPDLLTSRQLLTDWLKSLETETGVPLSRTILGGFSQGGAMTLDVGLHLPLAGLMVLSGYLHGAITPSGNCKAIVPSGSAYPPILMVHGRQDPVVPISAAHRAKNQLTTLGAKIQYKEFDMGHEVSSLVLQEVQQFAKEILG